MILQTANGPKEIKVADLDFTNLMCDLEDHDGNVWSSRSDNCGLVWNYRRNLRCIDRK